MVAGLEDLKLQPFGAPAGADAERGVAWRPGFAEPLHSRRDVSRNPTCWVLSGTFFVCGFSPDGLIQTHFIALCGDYGLAAVPTASVLAMIGAFDFVGTIGSGWLSER